MVKQDRNLRARVLRFWNFLFPSLFYLLSPTTVCARDASTAEKIVIPIGNVYKLPAENCIISKNKSFKLTKGTHTGLAARASGQCHIECGKKKVDLIATSTNVVDAFEALKELGLDDRKLSLNVTPQKILVTGEVQEHHQFLSIIETKSQFPESIDLNLIYDESVIDEVVHSIASDFEGKGLYSYRLTHKGKTLFLESLSKDPSTQKTILEMADYWGLKSKIRKSGTLELKPLVEFDVVFAEVKKSFARGLGVKLPGSYSGSLVPTENFGSATFKPNAIDLVLNAFDNKSNGKILANPKIICRSGETARFLAGGELPLKVSGWKQTDVIWRQYGILLTVSPVADSAGRISTKIMTEVSLLDEGTKIDGVPGLLTNRVETQFDLDGSKTIALSGLVKQETGKGLSGTPILSNIPILGGLFESRDYRESKTELIVFVTPKVVSPLDPPKPSLPNMWHEDEL